MMFANAAARCHRYGYSFGSRIIGSMTFVFAFDRKHDGPLFDRRRHCLATTGSTCLLSGIAESHRKRTIGSHLHRLTAQCHAGARLGTTVNDHLGIDFKLKTGATSEAVGSDTCIGSLPVNPSGVEDVPQTIREDRRTSHFPHSHRLARRLSHSFLRCRSSSRRFHRRYRARALSPSCCAPRRGTSRFPPDNQRRPDRILGGSRTSTYQLFTPP